MRSRNRVDERADVSAERWFVHCRQRCEPTINLSDGSGSARKRAQLCDRPPVARDLKGLAALNPIQNTACVVSQVADRNVHEDTVSRAGDTRSS